LEERFPEQQGSVGKDLEKIYHPALVHRMGVGKLEIFRKSQIHTSKQFLRPVVPDLQHPAQGQKKKYSHRRQDDGRRRGDKRGAETGAGR
jgi:hypothetical protein